MSKANESTNPRPPSIIYSFIIEYYEMQLFGPRIWHTLQVMSNCNLVKFSKYQVASRQEMPACDLLNYEWLVFTSPPPKDFKIIYDCSQPVAHDSLGQPYLGKNDIVLVGVSKRWEV